MDSEVCSKQRADDSPGRAEHQPMIYGRTVIHLAALIKKMKKERSHLNKSNNCEISTPLTLRSEDSVRVTVRLGLVLG